MGDDQWLADRFEGHRPRLRAVAHRMLGSLAEADDAVQDTWVRASRAGAADVDNLGGWLTTITARVCLNMLRRRRTRGERPLPVGQLLPDPVVGPPGRGQPDDEAVLADSVGLALLIVLDHLTPDQRLAFVLHDLFKLPYAEIAPMLDRSPAAARQLASRARRRVRGADLPDADVDPARHREVVDAFFRAARGGDLKDLVDLLHPDVVLRADLGSGRARDSTVTKGAQAVAGRALGLAQPTSRLYPALVDGRAGVVITVDERAVALVGFTVADARIVEINAIADPARVARLAAPVLDARSAAGQPISRRRCAG